MPRSMYDFLVEKNCGMVKEAASVASLARLGRRYANRGARGAAKKFFEASDAVSGRLASAEAAAKDALRGAKDSIKGAYESAKGAATALPGKASRSYYDKLQRLQDAAARLEYANEGAGSILGRAKHAIGRFGNENRNAAAGILAGAAGLGAAGLGAGGYAAYKGLAGNEEEAAIVDQALADPEVAQAVQEDPSILDQIVSFARENAGAVAGGLGGAGLGALTAAAMSKDNKLRNAAIAGILSGAIGAAGGAAYDRYGRK